MGVSTTKQQRRKKRKENWNHFRLKSGKWAAYPYYIGDGVCFAKPMLDAQFTPWLAAKAFGIQHIANDNVTHNFRENAMDMLHHSLSPSGLLNAAGMMSFLVASRIIQKYNDTPKGLFRSNIAATLGFSLLGGSMALSGNMGGMSGTIIGATSCAWLALNGYAQMNKKEKFTHNKPTILKQFIDNGKTLFKNAANTVCKNVPKTAEKVKDFIDNGISLYKKYPNALPGLVMTIANSVGFVGSFYDKDPVFMGIFATWTIGNLGILISRQENKPANDNSAMATPAQKPRTGEKTLSL